MATTAAKVVMIFFQFLIVFTVLAAEIIPEPINIEEKTFTYTEKYEFWEQSYLPAVSLKQLNEKYREDAIINPYPEAQTAFVLNAMIARDYDRWLMFWDERSLKNIKHEKSESGRNERMRKWEFLSLPDAEIKLVKMVQVGIAQYTYLLTICEIRNVKGEKQNIKRLYFAWAQGRDGKWRLSEELKNHPVFKKYLGDS